MSGSRARAFVVIGVLGLLITSAACCRSETGLFLSVDVSPAVIPADGTSRSRVLIAALNSSGAPVPDGTPVRLTTSAGDVTPVVYTASGHASGILTSSTCPQIAVITAIVDGATASTQVEFSSAGFDTEYGAAIRMTGGALAYCVEQDTVLGSGGVSIEYKGTLIRALAAQVCQTSGQIRAQGNVNVTRADNTLTADALACDTRSDRIRLLNLKPQPDSQTFDIKLRPVSYQGSGDSRQSFAALTNRSGNTWIVSQRLILIPSDKILFYKASIYVGDARVIKVPYYAYSYQKRESILQQIRYTSSEGVLVDLPVYYQLTDITTGAVKLRYAGEGSETNGYFRPRKGLSVGLEQDYSLGDKGHGCLFVDAVGTSTQAFQLTHRLDFGSVESGGRIDILTRYQPRSRYAKGIHSSALSVTGGLRSVNYFVYAYFGSSRIPKWNPLDPQEPRYVPQSSCSIRAIFRPKTPLQSGLAGRVMPSLTVGYGNLAASSGTVSTPCLYETVALDFGRTSSAYSSNRMSFEGSASFTLTGRGETGATLRTGPTFRGRWGRHSGSISCTLNLQRGLTDAGGRPSKYQLAGFFFLSGDRWSSGSFLNYGLDSSRLHIHSSFNWLMSKRWQFRASYSLYRHAYELNDRFTRYTSSYTKVGIYRALGLYEIGLAWSPDGRNYGTDRTKRVWLEVSANPF